MEIERDIQAMLIGVIIVVFLFWQSLLTIFLDFIPFSLILLLWIFYFLVRGTNLNKRVILCDNVLLGYTICSVILFSYLLIRIISTNPLSNLFLMSEALRAISISIIVFFFPSYVMWKDIQDLRKSIDSTIEETEVTEQQRLLSIRSLYGIKKPNLAVLFTAIGIVLLSLTPMMIEYDAYAYWIYEHGSQESVSLHVNETGQVASFTIETYQLQVNEFDIVGGPVSISISVSDELVFNYTQVSGTGLIGIRFPDETGNRYPVNRTFLVEVFWEGENSIVTMYYSEGIIGSSHTDVLEQRPTPQFYLVLLCSVSSIIFGMILLFQNLKYLTSPRSMYLRRIILTGFLTPSFLIVQLDSHYQMIGCFSSMWFFRLGASVASPLTTTSSILLGGSDFFLQIQSYTQIPQTLLFGIISLNLILLFLLLAWRIRQVPPKFVMAFSVLTIIVLILTTSWFSLYYVMEYGRILFPIPTPIFPAIAFYLSKIWSKTDD